jgi:hypothetical protein
VTRHAVGRMAALRCSVSRTTWGTRCEVQVTYAHLTMRSALALVLVAAVAPTTAAARTKSRTHHFAPAPNVTVSFALPKHRVVGEIIRFKSNRVSVVQSRRGTLSLRAKGKRTRRLAAPRHRKSRIVVTLSGSSSRVKIRVRRKAHALRGTFRVERAVAVRKRAVVGLRISTSGRRAPATTTLPAAPAPAPPVAAPRLFAPDSVWNAPLPATTPLDPANAVLTQTLRNTVAQNVSAGWGPWISTSETSPLYTVPADQPSVRVKLDAGAWATGLQQTFESVPIPANAAPAAGPDAHMTVWQPSTDRLWEFFKASRKADGWHASFGGAMNDVSSSPGYFDTSSWPGLSQPVWGATATSLPVIAGTIMVDELRAGVIPHALAMNIPWAKPKVYSFPAQRTDGSSTDPNAIPEGARFRLDPALDLNTLNLPPLTRMIAVAAQRYGMIVRDQTGHAISLFAENSGAATPNPYVSAGGFFGGPNPTAVMKAFPWDRLQLVRMDLRSMR